MPAIYVNNKDALPERAPNDHYPTPIELCRAVVNLPKFRIQAKLLETPVVLDPGAGTGPWGRAYREMCPGAQIVGVEIDQDFIIPPQYNHWLNTDFLALPEEDSGAVGLVDVIIGNPPYKLAEEFVRKSMVYLKPNGGKMAMLLRTEFQNSARRARGLWREFPPSAVMPLAQRPSFNGKGTQPQDYTLYVWEKDFRSGIRVTQWVPFDWRPDGNDRENSRAATGRADTGCAA